MKTRVNHYSETYFEAIAEHLNGDFICAGSFPAFVVANQLSSLLDSGEVPRLKYNDIDVYYGKFGDGEIVRHACQWAKMGSMECEVNLISCTSLNTENLIEHFDINAVALCVYLHVQNSKVSTVE